MKLPLVDIATDCQEINSINRMCMQASQIHIIHEQKLCVDSAFPLEPLKSKHQAK